MPHELSETERRAAEIESALAHEFFKHAPVSMWACDRDFNIVLWNPGAEVIYGFTRHEAIGQNYLDLFVDQPEREQSCRDCRQVIDNGWTQHNCLAYDSDGKGGTRRMLTNVFRITDPVTGQALQAEIGVEISDLGLREVEHRNLREVGIAKIASVKQPLQTARESLLQQLDKVLLDVTLTFKSRQRECRDWHQRLERAGTDTTVAKEALAGLRAANAEDVRRLEELTARVSGAKATDEMKALRQDLDELIGSLSEFKIDLEESS